MDLTGSGWYYPQKHQTRFSKSKKKLRSSHYSLSHSLPLFSLKPPKSHQNNHDTRKKNRKGKTKTHINNDSKSRPPLHGLSCRTLTMNNNRALHAINNVREEKIHEAISQTKKSTENSDPKQSHTHDFH